MIKAQISITFFAPFFQLLVIFAAKIQKTFKSFLMALSVFTKSGVGSWSELGAETWLGTGRKSQRMITSLLLSKSVCISQILQS